MFFLKAIQVSQISQGNNDPGFKLQAFIDGKMLLTSPCPLKDSVSRWALCMSLREYEMNKLVMDSPLLPCQDLPPASQLLSFFCYS